MSNLQVQEASLSQAQAPYGSPTEPSHTHLDAILYDLAQLVFHCTGNESSDLWTEVGELDGSTGREDY
jgi:hypothetical protein